MQVKSPLVNENNGGPSVATRSRKYLSDFNDNVPAQRRRAQSLARDARY
jgi:hypothetical protein